MTTSPESSAENPAAQPAAKSAQLRGRTEPHMHSFNMPQCEPINPYERPSYPFFYVPTDLLIGGSWVTGDNGSFPVHNPSCGQILTHVADASVEQGIEALDAACDARASWAATSARERADILNRAYTLMTQRTEVIARLMTLGPSTSPAAKSPTRQTTCAGTPKKLPATSAAPRSPPNPACRSPPYAAPWAPAC